MSVLPRRPLIVAASAALALFASTSMAADRVHDTSAGGACHAANGAAASKFSYGNHTIANIGTTDQYVVCHFQMDDDAAALFPSVPEHLSIAVTAGGFTGTVTCLAQIGYHANGANFVRSGFARSSMVAAGNHAFLMWVAGTAWVREANYETLSLNCKVPPGFKLGLIEWHQ